MAEELSYDQLKELAGLGAAIHVHLGEAPTVPPVEPPPISNVVYGKGNGEKKRLKLWTPYNHNGVIQENANGKLIMLEASSLLIGGSLAIQNSDEFIIMGGLDGGVEADSGGIYSSFWHITFFRDEDALALEYLRDPSKVPYANIKPLFYVPTDLVEIVAK